MGPENTLLTILEIYGRSKTVLKAYGDIAHGLASTKISSFIVVCEQIDISKEKAFFIKEKTKKNESGTGNTATSADLNYVYEGKLNHSCFAFFKTSIRAIDKRKFALDVANYYSKKYYG